MTGRQASNAIPWLWRILRWPSPFSLQESGLVSSRTTQANWKQARGPWALRGSLHYRIFGMAPSILVSRALGMVQLAPGMGSSGSREGVSKEGGGGLLSVVVLGRWRCC